MKHWLQAARLRTLPLSVSGIVVGSAMAKNNGQFNFWIFLFAILTTLGLQILSNFANDYGDGVKGTDNEDRVGPKRALQSGIISAKSMKKGIISTAIITLLLALCLICLAFKGTNAGYSLFFVMLGIAAIGAAIKYTIGKSAYGYQGLGDVFVFVFFGLVSVVGVYFLYAKAFFLSLLLPAISIGFLSVAVLNLNNMRDWVNDQKTGKNTIVVKMGEKKAVVYHNIIVITAMLSLVFFTLINNTSISNWIYLVTFAPLIKHLQFVNQNKEPKALDPELKKVALSTFFVAILFSLGLIIW